MKYNNRIFKRNIDNIDKLYCEKLKKKKSRKKEKSKF